MAKVEGKIDFVQLERELEAAIEADGRYWKENEAKLRAVHQAPTYDDFREIVAAAHLKPLDKDDKLNVKPTSVWNCLVRERTEFKPPSKSNEIKVPNTIRPQTVHELTRQWHELKTDSDRYQLLRQIGCDRLSHLHRSELSFVLFGESISVLANQLTPQDFDFAVKLLRQMTTFKRFKLDVQFLTTSQKHDCHQLLNRLKKLSETKEMEGEKIRTESVQELADKFNI